ncbi:MAG: YndJ family transporter [Planctomycetes bacterium]|nr:YndJ family transporter [Planctomycetota bacterium]
MAPANLYGNKELSASGNGCVSYGVGSCREPKQPSPNEVVRLGRPLLDVTARAVSGMSLAAGMSLALLYAAGRLSGANWIDISDMIPLHGLMNGLGFSLLGLISWWFDE